MIYTSKLTHRSGVVSSNFLVLNCCKFQKVDSLALVAKVWLWNTQALIGEHKCFCYKQKLPTILENKKRKLYEGCKILYEFIHHIRDLHPLNLIYLNFCWHILKTWGCYSWSRIKLISKWREIIVMVVVCCEVSFSSPIVFGMPLSWLLVLISKAKVYLH